MCFAYGTTHCTHLFKMCVPVLFRLFLFCYKEKKKAVEISCAHFPMRCMRRTQFLWPFAWDTIVPDAFAYL